MGAIEALVIVPVLRRRVIELRHGEHIVLTGGSVAQVVIRLIEKSGKKARLLVEAPDDVKIDTRGISAF
jgi:hypothetical protein